MNRWALGLRFIGVGFFIGSSIVLGLVLGIWMDGKFNTRFIWLIGLLLGIIVAIWGVYRMLLPLLDNDNNDHRSNG
jgi:F0F1-type ATP synthase assembly protein I